MRGMWGVREREREIVGGEWEREGEGDRREDKRIRQRERGWRLGVRVGGERRER